jgi:vancomycin resistance protein VanJ
MAFRAMLVADSLYVAVIAAIALLNILGPERWWWSGINLYIPQIVWAAPAALLLPLTIWLAPRWTWLPVAALVAVAGPLMGFEWNSSAPRSSGRSLRVMTYNVQLWQRRNFPAILQEVRAADPDVLCLQDAGGLTGTKLESLLQDRHVAAFGQYLIVSRFPVVQQVVGDISYRGERHTYLRALLDVEGIPVVVATAHFTTPRDALTVLRTDEPWGRRVGVITQNFSDRRTQAQSLSRDLLSEPAPIIVAGDFNAPSQSIVVRWLTGIGLTDTFASAGFGYGYTFGHTLSRGWSFLRIDHILVSRHLVPVRSWVGGATGSDHRPVIADVVLVR